MIKHTLFLVHGMGRFEEGWEASVWKKLKEVANGYSFFHEPGNNLDDWVEVVPLNYDSIIRKTLQEWQDEAVSFSTFAKGMDLAGGSLDFLTDIADDDQGFALSHLADVIIYRYFQLQRGHIKASIKAVLASRIQSQRKVDSRADFSILAHSLGTSVIHDSLAEMGAETGVFSAMNFKFQSIHMLANVSRLLESVPQAYRSVVRPGSHDNDTSCCQEMYSYSHSFDPFLFIKPFAPEDLGESYLPVAIDHFRDWNVHGFEHYLDHPAVHIPILNSITHSGAINPNQSEEAISAYPKFRDNFEMADTVENKWQEIQNLAEGLDKDSGLKSNAKILLRLWDILGQIKKTINGNG